MLGKGGILALLPGFLGLGAAVYVGPYKMTFSSAEPRAAQAFVLKYLGARYEDEPFPDGNGHCAMIRWAWLPHTTPNIPNFTAPYELHFVKGYGYKNGSMSIDDFENAMAAFHGDMSSYDQFIDFHTSFWVEDLDPLALALHDDGIPMLVRRYADGNFSIFFEVPHAIVIEVVAPKLTVLTPQRWARCGTPVRASVNSQAMAQQRTLKTKLSPLVPLRAVYPSTRPADSAKFSATFLDGRQIGSPAELPGSGNGSCYEAQAVRFESKVGFPYEMWWINSPKINEGKPGALKRFEQYLLGLHGNISDANTDNYDEYMDFHLGLWYDDGDELLKRLKATNTPYFLKKQAKTGVPDFFIEDPVCGQIYEMQALYPLKTPEPMALFNLCQEIPKPPKPAPASKIPHEALECSTGDHALKVTYDVKYYGGEVHCGTLLTKADAAQAPLVRYDLARADRQYTMIYASVDSHIEKSWPDNTVMGEAHVHWMVGNISAATLKGSGNLSEGALMYKLWPHHGPSPSQRYSFELYEHDGPTPPPGSSSAPRNCYPDFTDFCKASEWKTWLHSYPWTKVASNWLTLIYYEDTFRAPSRSTEKFSLVV
mmetsp:Transcript_148648/g.276969  ORF Transcript_148648/g.276969 Transcript_148648/m.276969 type:complete len:596 (+) Transcript_148648:74-1861(+)